MTGILAGVFGPVGLGIRFASSVRRTLAGIVIAVLWVIAVSVVLAALSVIFQTALYHFAVDGQVPSDYFGQDVMQTAFRQKTSGGGHW